MCEMPESDDSPADLETLAETLRRMEGRLEALEKFRERVEGKGEQPPFAVRGVEIRREEGQADFDLALIGRTLIVLGGAYLLRALTEASFLPAVAGVSIGLLYAVSWSIVALRPRVSRRSAIYHGLATTFIALPLIFEVTWRFHVLDAWSSALALLAVTMVMYGLVGRRRMAGLAWTFTLLALALAPLLMLETKSIVPGALYLTALGVTAVWFGYILEWHVLRWLVAAELNAALLMLGFLVATERIPATAPEVAIAVGCMVFAAYLASFAIRTLLRGREVIVFEVVQTLALLVVAVGGAMWVAASRGALEIPLALFLLLLGAASYAVSFAFIPRRFATPANFVCYSSLALMLIVAGGAFLTTGLLNSLFWVALALTSAYFAVHYRKSSLALHAGVFLFSGFVGAGVISLGVRSLLLSVEHGWAAPAEGAVLLLLATVVAAGIRPIEREGTFELWSAAKVMILAELGWIVATLIVSAIGFTFLNDAPADHAIVSVIRTGVIAGLALLSAWASRFAVLSPARLLCNAMLVTLILKLMWEDFRVGRPATLFASLAIVGAALILTPALRRKATHPQPATVTPPA
jgi:hypothetical protein